MDIEKKLLEYELRGYSLESTMNGAAYWFSYEKFARTSAENWALYFATFATRAVNCGKEEAITLLEKYLER